MHTVAILVQEKAKGYYIYILHGSGASCLLVLRIYSRAMATVADVVKRLDKLEADFGVFKSVLDEQRVKMQDRIEVEFTNKTLEMENVILGAKTEFEDIRSKIQYIFDETAKIFADTTKRLDCLEQRSGGKQKGYLPVKNTLSKTMSNKSEEWKQWKSDVEDFVDDANPGMKEMFREILKEKDSIIDKSWIEARTGMFPEAVIQDSIKIYRLLKGLTDGEARKVLNIIKDENGFRAWQKLNQRFEPGLAIRQGMVLAEFSGMVAKPAKSPAETKLLLTEIEQKIRLIEDITGEEVTDNHAKSVLIGVLDPMTRQHTAMKQGMEVTFEKFKQAVMEFTNNVQGQDDMQIGRIEEEHGHRQDHHYQHYHQEESHWGEEVGPEECGQINGMGKGGLQQCYNCKGYGHLARDCPTPKQLIKGGEKGSGKGYYIQAGGKDAGKGFGKESGKGKGKGDFGGKARETRICYNCGEAGHLSRDCKKPRMNAGKGGVRLLGDWMSQSWGNWTGDTGSPGEVRRLSCLGKPCQKEGNSGTKDMPETEVEGEEWWVASGRKRRKWNMKESQSKLNILQVIEPENVAAVKTEGEWEQIDFAVDSGATETVVGEDMLESVETKEGVASRRGVTYEGGEDTQQGGKILHGHNGRRDGKEPDCTGL